MVCAGRTPAQFRIGLGDPTRTADRVGAAVRAGNTPRAWGPVVAVAGGICVGARTRVANGAGDPAGVIVMIGAAVDAAPTGTTGVPAAVGRFVPVTVGAGIGGVPLAGGALLELEIPTISATRAPSTTTLAPMPMSSTGAPRCHGAAGGTIESE